MIPSQGDDTHTLNNLDIFWNSLHSIFCASLIFPLVLSSEYKTLPIDNIQNLSLDPPYQKQLQYSSTLEVRKSETTF